MIGIGRKKKEAETNSDETKKTLRDVLGLKESDKIKKVKLKVTLR